MCTWCAVLTIRSRIDSATTGLGNSEYQSEGGHRPDRRGSTRRAPCSITDLADLVPPAPDGLDGEGGCVGGVADIDPALVVEHVVDPIGDGLGVLGQFRIGEVVHVGALGFTRWSPFSPSIGVVVDQFLFRVNGDNRLAVVDEGVCRVVEMANWASRLSSNDLSPPPGARSRTEGSMPAATSLSALITVLRLIPDAWGTADLPPTPKHLCPGSGDDTALHLVHMGQHHYYARINQSWILTALQAPFRAAPP
jgi:hypothetical protein